MTIAAAGGAGFWALSRGPVDEPDPAPARGEPRAERSIELDVPAGRDAPAPEAAAPPGGAEATPSATAEGATGPGPARTRGDGRRPGDGRGREGAAGPAATPGVQRAAAAAVPQPGPEPREAGPGAEERPVADPRPAEAPALPEPPSRDEPPSRPETGETEAGGAPPPASRDLTAEAQAAYFRGELPNALALYRQAVARSPGNAAAWRGLGLVASRMGQPRQAAEAFRRYLALRPDAPDAEQIRQRLSALGQ
jgi:hypothetical protein